MEANNYLLIFKVNEKLQNGNEISWPLIILSFIYLHSSFSPQISVNDVVIFYVQHFKWLTILDENIPLYEHGLFKPA